MHMNIIQKKKSLNLQLKSLMQHVKKLPVYKREKEYLDIYEFIMKVDYNNELLDILLDDWDNLQLILSINYN